MKKTYFHPQMSVHVIHQRHQLLAGSVTSISVQSEDYDEGYKDL